MAMDLQPYRTAILTLHDRHEMFRGLHEVHGNLDIVDFWRLFREVWTATKSRHLALTYIRDVLTSERLNSPGRLMCMTNDEVNWLKRATRRNKAVKVYRGAGVPNFTGFSWTPKIDIARHHAERSGYETGQLLTARVEPHSIILYIAAEHEVIAFPEHVSVEKVDEVPGLVGNALQARRVQALVEAQGANAVMQLSQADYFMAAVKESKMDPEKLLTFMESSAEFLEPLGFKERLESVRAISAALRGNNGIRREE